MEDLFIYRFHSLSGSIAPASTKLVTTFRMLFPAEHSQPLSNSSGQLTNWRTCFVYFMNWIQAATTRVFFAASSTTPE